MNEYDLSLKEIFDALWAKAFFITIFTAIFAISSVFYALSIPNIYKSETVLAFSSSDSTLSRMSGSSLGGLASLAGVNIGAESTSDSEIVLQVMQSWGFIEEFIKKNELEVDIIAAKGWNKKENKLIYDDEIYDEKNNKWLRESTEFIPSNPTSYELYERFNGMYSVSKDPLNGLISVSIEHFTPDSAKNILEIFIQETNDFMRNRKLEQVNQNIKYLQSQVKKTTVSETRKALYSLIQEEYKNKMLAEVNFDFSFVVVQKAMTPEIKAKPKRAQIVLLMTLFAGILSCIIVLIRFFVNKEFSNIQEK
jgi:LPS O-antigen subunit length determinant protein (WzzB/FepE family)